MKVSATRGASSILSSLVPKDYNNAVGIFERSPRKKRGRWQFAVSFFVPLYQDIHGFQVLLAFSLRGFAVHASIDRIGSDGNKHLELDQRVHQRRKERAGLDLVRGRCPRAEISFTCLVTHGFRMRAVLIHKEPPVFLQ